MSFMPHPFPPPPPPPPMMAGGKPTIKLALEAPNAEKDGPFVRVQLTDSIGPHTLETLRDRALELYRMNHGPVDSEAAKVFFTYRDAENDLCFIFTDEDLRCAISPHFPTSLRVFARVEVNKRAGSRKSSASTQTSQQQERSFSDIPVHKVVETVVGVLTAASVALQKHVKVNTPASSTSTRSTATSTEPSVAEAAVTAATAEAAKPRVAEAPAAAPAAEERPFIHGRHTCDNCLTTPIVGIRYHATNLQDYDLCAACKGNYKGDEITFEAAELDRDRPMQERWNRRYLKWAKKQDKQQEKFMKKQARRSMKAAPPAPTPPAVVPPPVIAAPVVSPPCPNPHGPPFGPPPHQVWGPGPRRGGGRRCGGARHWNLNSSAPPSEQENLAMKRAIDLSLKDLEQQKKNEEEKKKEAPIVASAAASEEPEAVKPSEETTEEPVEEKFEVPPEAPVGKPIEKSEEPVKKEEEFVIPPEAPVGAPPAVPRAEDEKAEEETEEAPAAEETFTEDAEGNGDVAAALGETMDLIASAIEDLNSELVRGSSDDASEKSDTIVVDAAEESVKAGATIVQGEEEEEEEVADDGSNSWDVVSDEKTANDEALARAASVIGSVLFESEIKGSNGSSKSDDSVPMLGSEESLPTTLPSVVSEHGTPQQAQLDRWALHLKQLHEIGFTNDEESVEVLERLQAANIGSGETDEVSVERVINELVRNW